MSVPGIRFYPTSITVDASGGTPIFTHGTIDEDRSDFDLIFEPLYPLWSDLHILYDSDVFDVPDDDQSDEEVRKLLSAFDACIVEDGGMFRRRHLAKILKASVLTWFGRYVFESWNEFLLFENGTSLERAREVENMRSSSLGLTELPEDVVCILQNWDGVFWQIFTNQHHYLDKLCEVHADSRVLPAYWAELSEDYPNPRGRGPEESGMKKMERGNKPYA